MAGWCIATTLFALAMSGCVAGPDANPGPPNIADVSAVASNWDSDADLEVLALVTVRDKGRNPTICSCTVALEVRENEHYTSSFPGEWREVSRELAGEQDFHRWTVGGEPVTAYGRVLENEGTVDCAGELRATVFWWEANVTIEAQTTIWNSDCY